MYVYRVFTDTDDKKLSRVLIRSYRFHLSVLSVFVGKIGVVLACISVFLQ